MKQPKKLIKDVTFNFDKEATKCGPHIAYTLPIQGGAASGKNTSFLFKAEEVGEEVYKALSELGIEEVTKDFGLYDNKRRFIEHAVREQFGDDEWVWVVDFNDNTIYFSNCKGVYAVGYEYDVATGEIILEKLAEKAIQLNMFTIQSGKMKLSEEAEDQIEEGLLLIMEKALEAGENFEHLEVLKSLVEGLSENPLQEDVDKSSEVIDSDPVLESNFNVHPDTGITKNKEESMTENVTTTEQLDVEALNKSLAEMQDLLKAEKAAREAAEAKATEIAKAAEAERIEKAKADMTDVVKGWESVENTEEVVEALFKAEDSAVLIKAMESMNTRVEEIKKSLGASEAGIDGEITVTSDVNKAKDAVAEILKNRKEKQSK